MRSLGEPRFGEMLRAVSMSRLKTYQIFEQIKVRTHLTKLNSEHLRKASPRLWARLEAGDQELAADISQAILVSHLEMIIAALDLLGIPHNDGFFSKDADVASHLAEGWQQRVYDALKDKHPPAVLAFYINHLAVETVKSESIFIPAAS
jgi:hypothetical protein